MKYTYFPGCSLESTAHDYDVSSRAVMKALDSGLVELPDWNCCGATGAEVLSHLLSFALPARNLAKAKPLGDQIVTTCSACYSTSSASIASRKRSAPVHDLKASSAR